MRTVKATLLFFAALLTPFLIFPSDAISRSASRIPRDPAPGPGQRAELSVSQAAFSRDQGDTVWFGGDDGTGHAVEGGLWDFEGAGGQGDLQGWESVDLSENDGDFFRRVTAEDFTEDPCQPMFPATVGMIWCGVHEDEALARDYVTGMGYGDDFRQYARSPKFAAGDLSVSFDYFTDSEPGYDYTYLYVICFDAQGVTRPDGQIQFDAFDGIYGSPQAPLHYTGGVSGSMFPAWTDSVAFEIRFESDGAWSDEDGLYDCACGPFAADNVDLTVGSVNHFADFEEGPDGYTFGRRPGAGHYMGLVDQATYEPWLEYMGLHEECALTGWVIELNDEENSPYPIPGHPEQQYEAAESGIVDRTSLDPGFYNTTLASLQAYLYTPSQSGVYGRPGYRYYPYTTPENPEPRWSPRYRQTTFYMWDVPFCGRVYYNLTTMNPSPGGGLPADYEKIRFFYEIMSSCDFFGVPPSVCTSPGDTKGAPLIDQVRVGLTHRVDAPAVALQTGHQWHDGFGQLYPTYLDPADVGNANVSWDLSLTNVIDDPANDWHADSAQIVGPTVTSEDSRWLVDLCFRVARKGPLQDAIPEYALWKARLSGDPEADFVCVTMDSMETPQGAWRNRFVTYFHESDPGFDPAYSDLSSRQEILPDSLWTPGTQLEYYYRAYWYNGGATPQEYYLYPTQPDEFEILPGMVEASGSPYEIQWPAVLYVDAFNRGAQYYLEPMLEAAGVVHDRYDYLNTASNYFAPLRRSYGGTTFNPGGWGNNGMTDDQALGYRCIVLDTGSFTAGAMEYKDWALFDHWAQATECGLGNLRRGLLFTGDGIAEIMNHHVPPGRDLLMDVFGATLTDPSFREYTGIDQDCLYLLPSDPHAYQGSLDWTLFGNGYPSQFTYDLLGLSGVEGALGNLNYSDGSSEWEFAEVVNDQVGAGGSNWRTAVTGFSLSHISYDGCGGEPCRLHRLHAGVDDRGGRAVRSVALRLQPGRCRRGRRRQPRYGCTALFERAGHASLRRPSEPLPGVCGDSLQPGRDRRGGAGHL